MLSQKRRCRAAAAGAVLEPLGGNCAVMPLFYKLYHHALCFLCLLTNTPSTIASTK